MPFTPFHLGPGLALKAAGGGYFSLITFVLAQVIIDIEPLLGFFQGADVLHGRSHSYAGATLAALCVWLASPWICRPILRRWNRELTHYHLNWLCAPARVAWPAVAAGAFAGAYSHVALDSLIYTDMLPFWPWSPANPLVHRMSPGALEMLCILSGLAGFAGWFLRKRKKALHRV